MVKYYIFTVILLLLIYNSCTHTYVIKKVSDEDRNFSRLKHSGNTHDGEITLLNDHIIKAKNLRIYRDSTQWFNSETQQNQQMPNSQIKEIKLKNHISGAVGGLMIGLLPTTITAVLLAYLLFGENPDKPPGTAAGLGIIGVAALGSLAGFTTGLIIGDTERYLFETQIDTTDINRTDVGKNFKEY